MNRKHKTTKQVTSFFFISTTCYNVDYTEDIKYRIYGTVTAVATVVQ